MMSKKDNFEALMAAIRVKAVRWEETAKEYESDIRDATDLSKLECFNYGMAAAYKQAATELRRWL